MSSLCLLVAGCGSTISASEGKPAPTSTTLPAAAPGSAGAHAAVLLERLPGGGDLLVDAAGAPLWFNAAEVAGGVGSLTCTGACLADWSPELLPVGDLLPEASSLLSGHLGVVVRPDGRQQVSFDGAPLYVHVAGALPAAGSGWNRAELAAANG